LITSSVLDHVHRVADGIDSDPDELDRDVTDLMRAHSPRSHTFFKELFEEHRGNKHLMARDVEDTAHRVYARLEIAVKLGVAGDAEYNLAHVLITRLAGEYHRQVRAAAILRREEARLFRGMVGEDCYYVVITRSRCDAADLRAEVCPRLYTRLRQDWPGCQVWSAYDWSEKRAFHINLIIKHAPGLTEGWLRHQAELRKDGTEIYFGKVGYRRGIVNYVLTRLYHALIRHDWPKYGRGASASRGWCAWTSQKGLREERRSVRRRRRFDRRSRG
jgi:hypothetical protein